MHINRHWTDDFHRLLLGIADLVNRFDVDTRLLTASDVKLDRALFPLLSRLSLHDRMTTAELANLIGRDHSTVSRQIAKLESLGLVERTQDPDDARARFLAPTASGWDLLKRVSRVRQRWIEDHFASWPEDDRDTLIALLTRAMGSRSWPAEANGAASSSTERPQKK